MISFRQRGAGTPRRTTGTLFSVGALALLVAGGTFAAVTGPPADSSNTGSGTETSATVTKSTPPPGKTDGASVDEASVDKGGTAPSHGPAKPCPALTATDRDIPAKPPADESWSVFRGLMVPSSPTAGPGLAEGELQRCHAHTPTGALLAAAQISARYFLAADWQLVAERSIVPGPVRDSAVARRAAIERVNGVADDPRPESLLQIAGFRFVSYSPDRAVLDLVRGGGPGDVHDDVTSAVYTLVWSGGDWKLELRPDGSAAQTTPLTEVVGVVPWGGAAW